MKPLVAALLVCAPLGTGCNSSAPPPSRPLPFHVAIAPLAGAEVTEDDDGAGLRLQLQGELIERLNARLSEELGRSCFAKLTILEPPGHPEQLEASDEDWLELAMANTEADLLLNFELRQSTKIYEEINPIVHAAAPLSWLPGPQLWAVPDRRYTARCTLTVNVFDLAKFEQHGNSVPTGTRLWYFTHTTPLRTLYSSYVERVGWDLHYYPPALMLPTMLVDLQNEEFEAHMNDKAVDLLAVSMADDLLNRNQDVIRNDHDFDFLLEADTVRIQRLGPKRASVEFILSHRDVGLMNEPSRLVLQADSKDCEPLVIESWQRIDRARLQKSRRRGFQSYAFQDQLEVSPGTELIHLRVEVGDSPKTWRRFSMPLPPRGESDDS